jgi:hypothetical protein
MAVKLSTYMLWARMSQVASVTVILGTNGWLIRLSQSPFLFNLSATYLHRRVLEDDVLLSGLRLTDHYLSVHLRRLGLTTRMIAIQNLAALVLFYTLIPILVLHICRKSARTSYVVASIIGDFIFTGVCLAILVIYSIAGVPADCGGLTRQNSKTLYTSKPNPYLI